MCNDFFNAYADWTLKYLFLKFAVRRPDKDKSKRTPYCYFTVPDDDTTHVKFTVNFSIYLVLFRLQ